MEDKFAIDVTWVRHGIVGGTESYIINLLKGLMMVNNKFNVGIFTARDNAEYFEFVKTDPRFSIIICNVIAKNVYKRIIWQNLHLSNVIRKEGYNICVESVYAKPILFNARLKYV